MSILNLSKRNFLATLLFVASVLFFCYSGQSSAETMAVSTLSANATGWNYDGQHETFSIDGGAYTGFGWCLEYYDNVPRSGDQYDVMSYNRIHNAAISERLTRVFGALQDPAFSSLTQDELYRAIALSIWNITDNKSFSGSPAWTSAQTILANVDSGAYLPQEVLWTHADKSSNQDMIMPVSLIPGFVTTTNLTILKKTINGDGTFDFTSQDLGSGALGSGAFQVTTTNGKGSITFNDLPDGSYNLSESIPSGWALTDSVCDNGDTPDNVTIAGQSVVCTFTNQRLPMLSITKTDDEIGPVNVGDTITYTIVVENSGAMASNVTISDTLPVGLSYVPSSTVVTAEASDSYSTTIDLTDPNWTQNGPKGLPDTNWELGMPTTGPNGTHSGDEVWATNLNGNYGSLVDTLCLTSPVSDLTTRTDVSLSFWQWLELQEGDKVWVDVSIDNGATWTKVKEYRPAYDYKDTAWNELSVDISSIVDGQSQVQFRWCLDSSLLFNDNGWYIDDLSINSQSGGLVTTTGSEPPILWSSSNLPQGGVITVTFQALVDSLPTVGEFVNVATVSADNIAPLSDSESTPASLPETVWQPGIVLTKTVGSANDGEVLTVTLPATMTYHYEVGNTGDTALIEILVMDDAGTPSDTSDDKTISQLDCPTLAGPLMPGESVICDYDMYVVTTTVNLATATGIPTNPLDPTNPFDPNTGTKLTDPPVSESDDATVVPMVQSADRGDLPDSYSTTNATSGASHVQTDGLLYLGNIVDTEADGQPSADALGDNINGTNDEEGVQNTTVLIRDQVTVFDIVSSGDGVVGAWIDWDGSGAFDQPNEFYTMTVQAGNNQLLVTVPADYALQILPTRFRLYEPGTVITFDDYAGVAMSGEVEDYLWSVPTSVATSSEIVTTSVFASLLAISLITLLGATWFVLGRRTLN